MFRLVFSRLLPALLVLAAWTWTGTVPARAEVLTLAECLRETVEHNPQVVQQHYAIESALASRLTLRARAFPTLTVGGIAGELQQETVGTRTTSINPTTGKPQTTTTATIDENKPVVLGTETLYQSIFDAAIPASFRRGTAGVLAAEQNFYAVASAQLHATRLLFLQTLYQQKSGAVLRETDAVLASDVKSQNQLASAGLLGRAALLSAQVQRTNFNPLILGTAGTYRTNLARLLQVMGREPSVHGPDALAGITLAGTLGESLPPFDPADAVRRALERRPDLRSLRALVRANNEDANIFKAGYYPLVRLYLNGEAVPQSNVRNDSPNAVRASDQINTTEIRPGVVGSWTIIDTGTVRGQVRRQEATRDLLALSLAQLERNVPSDLAMVRARIADATSTSAALRGSLGTAQDTLNIIQSGVAQGINSQLEFLDAQGGLLSLRSSLLAADLELSLAHAEFDRITGNYLQFVTDDPPTARSAHHPSPAKK